MPETTVPVSEMRDHIADYVEQIEREGRVVITKNGREKAYLISVRELRALEETLAILENGPLMHSLREGLEDLRAGRARDAEAIFADITKEFGDAE